MVAKKLHKYKSSYIIEELNATMPPFIGEYKHIKGRFTSLPLIKTSDKVSLQKILHIFVSKPQISLNSGLFIFFFSYVEF